MNKLKYRGQLIYDGKDKFDNKVGITSLKDIDYCKIKGKTIGFSGFKKLGEDIFKTPIYICIDTDKGEAYLFYTSSTYNTLKTITLTSLIARFSELKLAVNYM